MISLTDIAAWGAEATAAPFPTRIEVRPRGFQVSARDGDLAHELMVPFRDIRLFGAPTVSQAIDRANAALLSRRNQEAQRG